MNSHFIKEEMETINKYTKRCSTLSAIRKYKAIMRCYCKPISIAKRKTDDSSNVVKDMETLNHSYIAVGNKKGSFLIIKTFDIHLPYNLAIAFLGIYPR